MVTEDKQAFVSTLERQHGKSLRRYLASRLKYGSDDLSDLVQEVFLRMLRIKTHETIRSPEAYLITIAVHILHQHAMGKAAQPDTVDILDVADELEAPASQDPMQHAEVQLRINKLERTLQHLSPKARAALILHRRDGYSVEEIGRKLHVSRAMAKKYLAQALAHCRKRIPAKEKDVR